MPITIQLEDEDRNALQSLAGPSMDWILEVGIPADTTCLRFIDPYGDTTFNRLQMPILHDELERAKSLISEESVNGAYDEWVTNIARRGPDFEAYARKVPRPRHDQLLLHISEIQRLIDHGLSQVHTYIRFVGD